MRLLYLFILTSLFCITDLAAQSDSTAIIPFRKGRNFVGLSGIIGSSSFHNDQGIFIGEDYINRYSFDIRLGKFVANKNLIGLVFNATRNHSTDFVEVEKEMLSAGPWYRLYLASKSDIGLYLQTSILYTYYVEHSEGFQGFIQIEEELRGHGISGTLGIGFAYVVADIVAFEVGFDYMISGLKGELIDLRNNNSQDLTFQRYNYQFSFGFNLMFGKLKKDE